MEKNQYSIEFSKEELQDMYEIYSRLLSEDFEYMEQCIQNDKDEESHEEYKKAYKKWRLRSGIKAKTGFPIGLSKVFWIMDKEEDDNNLNE